METTKISQWIVDLGVWPLIVVLVPNFLFRRYGSAAGKKRTASLLQGISIFLISTAAMAVMQYKGTDRHLLMGTAGIALLLFLFRKRVFPYRKTCPSCQASLDFKTIYFRDDNLCPQCRPKKEEVPAVPEAKEGEDDYPDYPELGEND